MRTVLSVNEPDKSMAFTGYMPQGGKAEFMKSNVHDLVNGEASLTALGGRRPALDDQTMTITVPEHDHSRSRQDLAETRCADAPTTSPPAEEIPRY